MALGRTITGWIALWVRRWRGISQLGEKPKKMPGGL